ncbi:MAG: DinB family protein [Vicinamibacterales bacterium]
MRRPDDAVREHLVRVLEWKEAHAGFDAAVAGLEAARRGARAPGLEHSPWQLLEHIRIAQADILDFCLNPAYSHDRTWPDDYWSADPAPPDDAAWAASIAACVASRTRLQALAREVEDLTASVPTGDARQTYLRAILLAADHAAYHVGQLVMVRKAIGAWG